MTAVNPPSMDTSTAQALVLAQKLWDQIQRRRWSDGTDSIGTDSKTNRRGPQGVHDHLNYYKGIHTLRFASDQFSQYFKDRFDGFSDNWCAPVIDAAAERMNWLGMRIDNDTQKADQDFLRVMNVNDALRGSSEAFTVALAASRSFGLVWGNDADPTTPLITFEHPEYVAIAKDPDTGVKTAAAKGWLDDHQGFLTLYTADAIWKWQWQVADDNDPRREVNWTPRQGMQDDTWPIKNPMGIVPIVEFRNQELLDDKPLSDLAGVAAMQDAINLLWAYLFNSLDFASLPQRIITGAEKPKVPLLDQNGQVIGEREVDLKKLMDDRILWMTGTEAKAQSWPAASLQVFSEVIETAVDHIATQSRTPPHYMLGKMANTAAESLTVSETGLVARVTQRMQYFTRPLREIHQLIALAQGDAGKAKAALTGRILWQNPQYRSLAQMTDAFQKMRQGGMPLEYMLEWYGLDPDEVSRVLEMAKNEPDVLVAPTPLKAAPGQILPKGNSELVVSPADDEQAKTAAETEPPSTT